MTTHQYEILDLEITGSWELSRDLTRAGKHIQTVGSDMWFAVFQALELLCSVGHGSDVERYFSWSSLELGSNPRSDLKVVVNVASNRERKLPDHDHCEKQARFNLETLLIPLVDTSRTMSIGIHVVNAGGNKPIEIKPIHRDRSLVASAT